MLLFCSGTLTKLQLKIEQFLFFIVEIYKVDFQFKFHYEKTSFHITVCHGVRYVTLITFILPPLPIKGLLRILFFKKGIEIKYRN